MVGDVGLEPTHPKVGVFETPLSAYSNNPPYSHLGAVAFGPYRQSHRRYLVTTIRLVFLLKLRESQSPYSFPLASLYNQPYYHSFILSSSLITYN